MASEGGNFPTDVNGYFRMLVGQAWEKANKRQKIKALHINRIEGNAGLDDVVDVLKIVKYEPLP